MFKHFGFLVVLLFLVVGSSSAFACGSWGIGAWCGYSVNNNGSPQKVLVTWDVGTGCHSNNRSVNIYTSKGDYFPLNPVGRGTGSSISDIDMGKVAKNARLTLPDDFPDSVTHNPDDFKKQLQTNQEFRENFARTGISESDIKDYYFNLTAKEGYSAYIFAGADTDSTTWLGGWMKLPTGETVLCQVIPGYKR